MTTQALVLACIATLHGCATHAPTTKPIASQTITTINGEPLPGQMARLVGSTKMLDTIDVNGQRIVVEKGVRKAGTRVAIHVHEFGGHTCVLSGEITGFMEGHAPRKWPTGSCYYMPPNVPMAAANLGTEDALLIDTFILPPGKPTITILEPGFPDR
ncbi:MULTISPECIES: cupin domain-containing protein [unclassified Bordetella]|uniref:cupin domain-containing protein n=1 Tax=unclassified Bordetella TaxID=2630031 RepID=UPI0013295021|nr:MULTISPECIES: cupin domain-containing protein [unclassified Bordetella]MVW72683.1 cupin domain-containing protein [Bordetella sp. 15P40C-2]MVW78361.1 cupin domain-containing protein [Bordetella sp. 02P26C-1]